MKENSSTPQVVRFQRRHRLRRLGKSILKGVFGLFGRLAPSLAAERAETLFLTPPRCARTRFERGVLEGGMLSYVDGPAGRLATYRWGVGPAVLLVHGWGGHAGRLARFVSPLTDAGFSVVAFDAPGHGSSDRTLCSLPEIAAAWPNAQFVSLRGVGHHRILRAPEVISGTVEFLAAGAKAPPLPSAEAMRRVASAERA